MTDKNQAVQQVSPMSAHSDAQHLLLLAGLNWGPMDTFTVRKELNIMVPATSVKELHARGHDIHRQPTTLTDDLGRLHHGIALYFLSTSPAPAQAEA